MKITTLALGILSAVLLVPTVAFARDRDRDKDCDRNAQIYADRRANGYYDYGSYAPVRGYETCRPDYRARYYVPDCDRRDYRRGGFFIRIP